MTFPYSSAIPNPPNDPADDVKTMQTNAGSINSIIAVDHVGFNVAGGGQHNQVTFNSNNPPTPPVSPPILFTNNVDGAGNSLPGSLAELFFYSGSTPQSKDQYNVTAANGSVMLPMGIILKWGSATFVGSQSPSVTFTNAFPNACFGVQLSLLNTGGTQTQNRLATVTASGFTANVNASGASTWYWLAIGN
jgi:hypothetical protein